MGERIRQERKKLDWTLVQLAEMAKIEHGYLSEIERNLKSPSEPVLDQLARGLNVTVEWMRTGRDPKHPDDKPFGRETLDHALTVKNLSPERRKIVEELAKQFDKDQKIVEEKKYRAEEPTKLYAAEPQAIYNPAGKPSEKKK